MNCDMVLFMGMVSMVIISGVLCWNGSQLVDSKLLVSSNGTLVVVGVYSDNVSIGVLDVGIGLVWFPKWLVF